MSTKLDNALIASDQYNRKEWRVEEMSFVTDVQSITPSSQTVSVVAPALTQPFLQ